MATKDELARRGPSVSRRALFAGLGLAAADLALASAADALGLGPVNLLAAPLATRAVSDHIVNGDFAYPWSVGVTGYVDPYNGVYNPLYHVDGSDGWHRIPGWDFNRFAWLSDQPEVPWGLGGNETVPYGTVQVSTGFAELVCHTPGNSIYQDVRTQPGAVYLWHVSHRPTYPQDTDVMRVLIGAPGRETAQRAFRGSSVTASNLVAVGTDISDSGSTFRSYCGNYLCPSGQTTTRFTFESVRGHGMEYGAMTEGNLVTNITFEIGWPLSYDLNGGSGGSMPQPHLDGRGIYVYYYVSGTRVSVDTTASHQPSRSGHSLLGWSLTKRGVVTSKAGADSAGVVTSVTMPNGSETLYAVWAKNPTIRAYVVHNGRSTLVASRSVGFGSTVDPSRDSWIVQARDDAKGSAGLPSSSSILGWWTSSACSGATTGPFVAYGDASIYCKPAFATVTYYVDGSSTPVRTEQALVGVTYNVSSAATSAATRVGCTPGFDGWYTSLPSSDHGAARPQKYSPAAMPSGGLKLYARNWATLTCKLVDPVTGERKTVGTKVYAYGTTVATSDSWVRSQLSGAAAAAGLPSGSYADGWWSSSACSGGKTTSVSISRDVTIYCTAVTALVRYFADRSTDPVLEESWYVGATYPVNPTATERARREGCTPGLAAWYTDPSDLALTADEPGQGGSSLYSARALPASGLDLYAVNRCTIGFETSSSSVRPDESVTLREGPGESWPVADLDPPSDIVRRVDRATSLPRLPSVYEPIGEGRWRTVSARTWHRDPAGQDSPVTAITPDRDITLYVTWRYRTTDGIVERRG